MNENEDSQATSVIDSIAKSSHPIETTTTGKRYRELAYDLYYFITFCPSLPKYRFLNIPTVQIL